MKDRLKHIEFRPYAGLKHVNISTPEGDARMHVLSRGDKSNISGAAHDVNWWRTGNARKGRIHQLLHTIQRKLCFWRR